MFTRIAALTLVVSVLPVVSTQTLLAQAPVGTQTFTVFVAAPMRDGFQDVSKDTSDTMKDIASS